MIATYLTIEEFKAMKNLEDGGVAPDSSVDTDLIYKYLHRATRYIRRFARRDFLPYYETKTYPIPYAFYDLAIRRVPDAHLKLGGDLLEIIRVNNGFEDLESSDHYALEHNVYPKYILVLRYPKYWGGSLASSATVRYDDAIIEVEGLWGYFDGLYNAEAWVDTLEVVQNGGIDAITKTLSVTDADGQDEMLNTRFERGMVLRIEDELLEVSSVDTSANEIEVIRGARNNDTGNDTAVSHDAGTKILRWRVIDDIKEACYQVAKTWREADISAGNRIGVSDQSIGAEIGIPQDTQTIIRAYQRSILMD